MHPSQLGQNQRQSIHSVLFATRIWLASNSVPRHPPQRPSDGRWFSPPSAKYLSPFAELLPVRLPSVLAAPTQAQVPYPASSAGPQSRPQDLEHRPTHPAYLGWVLVKWHSRRQNSNGRERRQLISGAGIKTMTETSESAWPSDSPATPTQAGDAATSAGNSTASRQLGE
jgi:hypothetical protein